MLSVGVSSSKNRAQEAAEQATLATLIGSSIEATSGVVYNITGGKDITLQEVNKVSQVRVGFLRNSLLILQWCFKRSYETLGVSNRRTKYIVVLDSFDHMYSPLADCDKPI